MCLFFYAYLLLTVLDFISMSNIVNQGASYFKVSTNLLFEIVCCCFSSRFFDGNILAPIFEWVYRISIIRGRYKCKCLGNQCDNEICFRV